ncbi:hypothetical protein [Rheinheimera hassiensis]|uniref:hypothetical protein n=1 Tax=Rheinheimera hassiensis TaxID=1193627 RepID=UPI001F0688C7|nr:hypothetical protein [Rheinheimera hassiensis]
MEDIDLKGLFSGIDTHKITKPLDNYLESLNSFFSDYNQESDRSLMRFFEDFNPDNFVDDDISFMANALIMANYDESALRGECVIIFSEPVIVSDLKCVDVFRNESEDALRLISYKGGEKKFTTKRSTQSDRSIRNRLITIYMVHDVVLGIILPKHSNFQSVKIVRYRTLHSDYKKLEHTQKALLDANDIPRIEIQKIVKKLDEINSIINNKLDSLNTIQGDIHALEQEKSHAESSLESSRIALEKARNDLDKTSRDFNKLVSSVADENDKLETVQAKVKAETSFFKKEQDKLKTLQDEIGEADKSLTKIRTELAAAKREKNLTNFDTLGHSTETGRQLIAYYWFAGSTFVGLLCMTVYIYWSSQNFSASFPYLLHVSGWNILLSRLPLVAATTLIMGGLSGVFFYLIKHIVSLNTEKMTMLKAGILAEQITNSLDCKDMDDQKRLEFQRNTKIKLITQVFSKNELDINQSNIIIEALKALNSK